MLFVSGALAIFVLGGLTGVMVALAPFDWQAHDTYFIVGHLHYVLIGGMLFPVVAGFYYFFPLPTGKQLSERLGAHRLLADVRRLQRRLPADAPHRPAGHAAARLHLSRRHRLGLAQPDLHASARSCSPPASLVFVWDVLRPKGKQPYSRAQPVERRHAGMAGRDAGQALGHRARVPIDREPLSAVGTAGFHAARSTRAASICRTPRKDSARRWSPSVLDAEPVQCLRVPGPTFLTVVRRACSPAACSSSRPFTGGWPASVSGVLALGLHRPSGCGPAPPTDPEKNGQGRRARADAAALRVGSASRSAGGRCSSP